MSGSRMTVSLTPAGKRVLKEYAKRHRMTVSQLVGRFAQQLDSGGDYPVHPELARFVGIIPENADPRREYAEHVLGRHR